MSQTFLSKSTFSLVAMLLCALFFQPLVASATCLSFSGPLHIGMSDARTNGAVSELQAILASDDSLYPEGEITGYFGKLTEKAVKRFQSREGIVDSGDRFSTGYGSVGPTTRSAIRGLCGEGSVGQSGGSLDVSDIDKIEVNIDNRSGSADVLVRVDGNEDFDFDIEVESRARMTTAIGEILAYEHGLDTSDFTSDARRDTTIKRKITWKTVKQTADATEYDIHAIRVTSKANQNELEVRVDMSGSYDDFDFDVQNKSSRESIVADIAEELEDSYDFDFSSFSSDGRRDSYINNKTTFAITTSVSTPTTPPVVAPVCTVNCTAYALSDVQTVTHVVTADKSKVYTVVLKDGSKRAVTVAASFNQTQVSLAFGATGYTGVAKSLIAKSKASNTYTVGDVQTITQTTVGATTTYTIVLKNDSKRTVRTTTSMTSAQVNSAFTASGYTGSASALIAKAVVPVVPVSNQYALADVKKVTHVLASDLSTVYTVTLASGGVKTVKVTKQMTATQVSLAFGATGYTGVAKSLIAKSVLSKAYALTDVQTITQSIAGATTTYTIVLKNKSKRVVKTTTRMTAAKVLQMFTASGYTGSVPALVAKAGGVAQSTTSKNTYTIADVKSVTRTIAGGTTTHGVYSAAGYFQYTVVTTSGKKHVVKQYFDQANSLEKGLRATGYSGDVSLVVNKAK